MTQVGLELVTPVPPLLHFSSAMFIDVCHYSQFSCAGVGNLTLDIMHAGQTFRHVSRQGVATMLLLALACEQQSSCPSIWVLGSQAQHLVPVTDFIKLYIENMPFQY